MWRVRLDALHSRELDRLDSLVAPSERERAQRFRFEDDRHRHLVGRALVRSVLAKELDRSPSAIEFDEGPYQKPELSETEPAKGPIEFNLAHADRWVLAVFRRGHSVGVDVEPIERTDGADGIARRVLTDREFAHWESISREERARFFMRVWTCKEAVLKATGEGLYRPPDTIECALDGSRITGIDRLAELDTELAVGGADQWRVESFVLEEEAAAAVAGEVRDEPLGFERIDGEALLRRALARQGGKTS